MISMVSIGCGRSNQDSGKKVTINILNYKRETVDILQKMIDKFEKENPNIQDMQYQVALTSCHGQLEYSFSCLIEYEDK